MRVGDRWYRTIWLADDGWTVSIIDQTALPGTFQVGHLTTLADAATAIRSMRVRGAPLIGVTAAYGVALAMRADATDTALADAVDRLLATRPTAINLRWALERISGELAAVDPANRAAVSYRFAADLADADVSVCQRIGEHGLALIESAWDAVDRARPVRILTHCNAGWLATVDWGTALAPIYRALDTGIPVHVWVSEARPRNQGLLTEWELRRHGVAHTLVVDSASGWLMRKGEVDLCLVGTDRTTRDGDVANKIGTYQKALAARDNGVPFYVALPSSSIDWARTTGDDIPIEERPGEELGFDPTVPVINPAFDVTPARLVTGYLTERGLATMDTGGFAPLFPERF